MCLDFNRFCHWLVILPTFDIMTLMKPAIRHAKQIELALAENNAARNPLVASWQRSYDLHRLQPDRPTTAMRLSAKEFGESREKLAPLIRSAKIYLDRLYMAIGGDGCCVLLADRDGVPVARRGAEADDVTFKNWGLWTGTGTNGIGSCIVEERPMTIHKGQHYHSKNTGLSCMAAPIFDYEGKLIAALDVSSCRSDLTPGFSRLISMAVIDAARQIEMAYFEYHFAGARVLLATPPEDFTSSGMVRSGASLVAVDRDDLVIGATRAARKLFDLNDIDLKNPLPLSMLYGRETDDAQYHAQAGRRIISQALARSGGNVSAAAQALGVSRTTLHRKIKHLKLSR